MPYFCNTESNILFIHIPKTGGSSVEVYLSRKYNIPLNMNSLFCLKKVKYNFIFEHDKIAPQHQTYNTLYKYRKEFNINFNDNLKIFTIVRNPYDRIISDLFFLILIKRNSTKEEVYKIINKYIYDEPHIHDNHNIPQYKYITDSNDKLIDNIIILKTESLNNDIDKLGYNNFNLNLLKNNYKIEYNNYLNNDSINLINKFYEKDFKLFNYKMKNII
jgi:hypothetical protein